MEQKDFIQKYQCCGCISGSDITCGEYKLDTETDDGFHCQSHRSGTLIPGVGNIYLGLPTGFNHVGPMYAHINNSIWIFENVPPYNEFNQPIWKKEDDGVTFVKVYIPRRNYGLIHIINGVGHKSLNDIPNVPDCD